MDMIFKLQQQMPQVARTLPTSSPRSRNVPDRDVRRPGLLSPSMVTTVNDGSDELSSDTEASPPLLEASTSATALTSRPQRFAPCLGHPLNLLDVRTLLKHGLWTVEDPEMNPDDVLDALDWHGPFKAGECSPCI